MTGSYSEALHDIAHFNFDQGQARRLDEACLRVAAEGGPDASGTAALSRHYAERLKQEITAQQQALLDAFTSGQVCAIEFSNMLPLPSDPPPDVMPPQENLSTAPAVIYLASRHQILLSLVGYRSFAFDIDNEGKQTRLVGNFKGGGKVPLVEEKQDRTAELNSHAGVSLGPHTEPPYNCSVKAEDEHSPAPSALILTARWNPQREPTRLTPMRAAIRKLNGIEALALTSRSFRFSRSECFIKDDSPPPRPSSILQFDRMEGFTLRYSTYRYSLDSEASVPAQHAFKALEGLVSEIEPTVFVLDSSSALLINNSQALHSRDTILDNRRLLVRLFAYAPHTEPLVLQPDPLVVRG
ncbi:hypothetical protein [Pseudomonas sp.]|uniref:hypothetical protein n=1 Tax=Pseudomonas sp. TaxID=306 RepID=UPI001B2053A6|nr:hypothetical protein [Pseudomonas sp.]MBO9552861.1 hypothetical protein [Pseudomonas sp.]